MKIIVYDALMKPEAMKGVVMSARNPTPVYLDNWSLIFGSGLPTLINEENVSTPAVVYEIDDNDLDLLESFYCVGQVYESYDTNAGKVFVLSDNFVHTVTELDMDFLLELINVYDHWSFDNDSLWNALVSFSRFSGYNGNGGVLH